MDGLLRFRKGDAVNPLGGTFRYILQVNNNEGKYGAGFSGAIAKKWPQVEKEYRNWWRQQMGKLKLGEIQVVQVQTDTAVINMIAQDGIRESAKSKTVHIKYDALEECLKKAAKEILDNGGSVHTVRIGCGLAGGSWNEVESIIKEQLIKKGINVTIYDPEEA